ncbi:MAG: hypothetical protein EXQ70_11355 [Solirubrobacterales bacterium]|nr:hypothetical protein [Solirubrobacterales bacterium]
MAKRRDKGKQAKRHPPRRDPTQAREIKHRWRDYSTESGARPVKEFLRKLSDEDLASVVAAMKDVRQHGLRGARHLEGNIYEVRADGKGVI